jgi:prophage regulatory protein
MADSSMADRFIAARVGLSKTEIYRRVSAGKFPRPVPLGPQRVAFLESEIEAWMAERVKARDAGEGSRERRDVAAKAVAARGKSKRAA